jgi:hypothetical protein
MKYSQIEASPTSIKSFVKPKKSKVNSVSEIVHQLNDIYRSCQNLHQENVYRELLATSLRLCEVLSS